MGMTEKVLGLKAAVGRQARNVTCGVPEGVFQQEEEVAPPDESGN